MTTKKRPFTRRIGKNAVGTNDTLDDVRIPDGFLRCYQRFGVLNDDTAYTLLRFVDGGVDPEFIISEAQNPAVDEYIWDDAEVWMMGEQFLRAKLAGTTSGDDISLHLIGFDVKIGKGN